MVVGVPSPNGWQHHIGTLWVITIVGAGTNNGTSVRQYVDFSTGMSETEAAAGDDWDWVAHIVHPREVRDLGIEVR